MALSIDLDRMLERIATRQWSLDDVDWAAPGAERVEEAQRAQLAPFMADLLWIEHIGARGFAALRAQAGSDATLAEVYRYFEVEERRHAAAELALMRRWEMVGPDEVPEPSPTIRLAIEWLDRYADRLPLEVLGTVIPMLEVVLDGALVSFVVDRVADPVAHEVFGRVNTDESRHLAVDFHVLEAVSAAEAPGHLVSLARAVRTPAAPVGLLLLVPMLSSMRDAVVGMGLDEQRLYAAMHRFTALGARSDAVRANPRYRFTVRHLEVFADRSHPYQHVADLLVALMGRWPDRLLPALPDWAQPGIDAA